MLDPRIPGQIAKEYEDRIAAMKQDAYMVERWAAEERREGVSAHAAARQLCRTLGCNGHFPVLKGMLEDLLADSNREAHERSKQRNIIRDLISKIVKH